MPKASQLILMVVSLVAFTRPTVALAGPVADADLRGKTICWSYGGTRNTYGKDGSLDSNLAGHGTWSLVGDRITEHGDHGVFSFTIEKQAGTLHMYGRSPGGGLGGRVTGSYCKMSLPGLVRAGEVTRPHATTSSATIAASSRVSLIAQHACDAVRPTGRAEL